MGLSKDTFAGQKVLITGASRGIGRAMALTFAGLGADVAVGYKSRVEDARSVCQEIEGMGRKAVPVGGDLEDPSSIDALFGEVERAFGSLDIFVSNAAATAFKKIMDLKVHNLDRTFALNVRGFVLSAQHAARLMGHGGAMVAISGFGSIRCLPGYAALGSAKAELETWVRYLAVELAPQGIRVNGVNPGYLETDSSHIYFERAGAADPEHVVRLTPGGRPTRPQDIADTVAFLCSDGAAFIYGQTLVVDGGLTLLAPPFARGLID